MDPADEERARAQSDRRTTTPDGRTSSSRSGMPRSDVEAIRGERLYRKTDHQFLVKYVGFDEYTWEPAVTILEQVADKFTEEQFVAEGPGECGVWIISTLHGQQLEITKQEHLCI